MAFDYNTLLSAELHDIKNQMQALLNAQENLNDALKDEPQFKGHIENVQQHSQLLNHKLLEILSILKIQNQAFTPTEDEHWLLDTLTPIIHEFSQSHGLVVNHNIDGDFNGFYDEQLLEIAVHNSLMNAKQIGAKHIEISVEEFPDGHWLINIQDNGPGFNEKMLFESTFTIQGGKSGLGLYLIQQALEAHKRNEQHGSIHIKNNPTGGACIQLIFP